MSRRTDIPAFYSEWLINRLKEGFVLVRNPMNPGMISKVLLEKDSIDCIVFWTRNPGPLLAQLHQLEGYCFCFLITITPYGKDLEKNLPPKDKIIDTVIRLSHTIGKEKVTWRYDPILLTGKIDAAYHYRHFENLAHKLASSTQRCIISFLDMYEKCKRNLAGIDIRLPGPDEMLEIAANLHAIAQKYHIEVQTCAEPLDFSSVGVTPGGCIDDRLIYQASGKNLDIPGDKHQRKTCCCVESIDIGAYDTCPHHCLYCYANSNQTAVLHNITRHDSRSPLLYGELTGNEKIVEREIKIYPPRQSSLFSGF